MLEKIRHNLAFHVGARALMRGYLTFFKQANPETHSDKAYVSLGNTMEQTRFYYADAAHIAAMADLAGMPTSEAHKQLSKVLIQMNAAIRGVLVMFLHKRTGTFPGLSEES